MDGSVLGVVLAAGAGSRFGSPKALARTADGEAWIARAVEALQRGGCTRVVVVLGAAAAPATAFVPRGVGSVVAARWAEGVSESLRAGLAHAEEGDAQAVVIVPVDTPDLPASAVARILAATSSRADALVQAVYEGVPGHPVLIGRDHWGAVAADAAGDRGAGRYLAAHGAARVECSDLWSGADIDAR